LEGPPETAELLKTLRAGVYQMRVDHDLHGAAVADFESAEAARTAGDLLRGLLALAKLRVQEEQDILRFLDGVSIDDSGARMTIGFDASGDLLKKLQDLRR
jgi:hypothetical protein